MCQRSGVYEFALWSGGGENGTGGGASGSFLMARRYLKAGEVVAVVVGFGRGSGLGSATSSLEFPNGNVAIAAGPINFFTAGGATGGDLNISGTDGGASFGPGKGPYGGAAGVGTHSGSGAPSYLSKQRGGTGATAGGAPGGFPGGGASGTGANGVTYPGGNGLCIIAPYPIEATVNT
jgi:hypothetical protein